MTDTALEAFAATGAPTASAQAVPTAPYRDSSAAWSGIIARMPTPVASRARSAEGSLSARPWASPTVAAKEPAKAPATTSPTEPRAVAGAVRAG